MNAPDELRTRATRSIGWVVLERWSSRLVTLVVLSVLARLLEPAQFGLVATAVSITTILQVFVDSGVSKTLIQKSHLGAKDATTAFWTALGISLLLSLGLCAAAPLLAQAFGQPRLTPFIMALSLLLPVSALSQTPSALLERNLEFKALSIRQLAGTLAGAVVAVPLAFAGAGAWALVAQTLASSLVATAVLWTSTDWRPGFEFSTDALRHLLRFGMPVLGIDLLDATQANLDKIVIGAFFSPEQLGYYFIAQRVGIIVTDLIVSVMARVSLTTFSRVQDDRPRLNRIFRQMTFVAAAVSIFVFGILGVFAPQVLEALFGHRWDDAVPILRVLSPGWALGAIMIFDRSMFLATSNARTALGLALFQNVVGIGLLFAFVPFGVMGVAASRLARIAVWPVRLIALRRVASVNVRQYMLQTLRCLGAALPVFVGLVLLLQTPWASAPAAAYSFVLPVTLIAGITYSSLLWLLAGAENRVILRAVAVDVARRLHRP